MDGAEVDAVCGERQQIFIAELRLASKNQKRNDCERGDEHQRERGTDGDTCHSWPMQARRAPEISAGTNEDDDDPNIDAQTKPRRVMRPKCLNVVGLQIPE